MKITRVKYIASNIAINSYLYSIGLFADTREMIALTKLKMLYGKFKKSDPNPERDLTDDEKFELGKLVYETYHIKTINGDEKCFGSYSFVSDWYKDEFKKEYKRSAILEYLAYFNLFNRDNYDSVIAMPKNNYVTFKAELMRLNEDHLLSKEKFEDLMHSYCANDQRRLKNVSGLRIDDTCFKNSF